MNGGIDHGLEDVVLEGLFGEYVDIPCGGVVALLVEAVGVDEVGGVAPKLSGPLVHQIHKGRDGPGHRLA